MCKVLEVTRSGYYAWRKRMPSERQKANDELLERIREIHKNTRYVYGSPEQYERALNET